MLADAQAPPANALLLQKQGDGGAAARIRVPRGTRACPADCQRPLQVLSWALALAVGCLCIGLIGLREPIGTPVKLLTASPAPAGEDSGELAMLELAAPAADSPADALLDDATPILPLPDPAVALMEAVPELEDLPELEVALTAKDLFQVPAAAPVEDMLTPSEPSKPAPRPAPATASRSPAATSGTTPSTGGGSGTSARGGASGYFPSPPYPAAARSRGMQGTVYLSITFGADGRVVSATVSRSSGYSELDRSASDWVRRTWRAPAGQSGTYRQPVHFRLR